MARSIKKGPFVDHHLMTKVDKARGASDKRPIILLSHMDVVSSDASRWKAPPFSGKIVDGSMYGRGAQDMKEEGLAQAHRETDQRERRHRARRLDRDQPVDRPAQRGRDEQRGEGRDQDGGRDLKGVHAGLSDSR